MAILIFTMPSDNKIPTNILRLRVIVVHFAKTIRKIQDASLKRARQSADYTDRQ
jgi:hypothetical protein